MTTTEQIQALQNAINQLQTQVNNISSQVSTNSTNLSLHILDCVDDINTITGRLGALTSEDVEIHQEIHDISVQTDNNTSMIEGLVLQDTVIDGRLDNLEAGHISLEQDLEDMDEEHHAELHLLALAIDNSNSRITNLEIFKEETPDMVVLTEDEYEDLGTPDYDTFYYTYED